MPELSRRKLIGSLISLVAAPAIVRVSSIMPVKAMEPEVLKGFMRLDFSNAPVRAIYRGYEFWSNGKDHVVHWRDSEEQGVWL